MGLTLIDIKNAEAITSSSFPASSNTGTTEAATSDSARSSEMSGMRAVTLVRKVATRPDPHHRLPGSDSNAGGQTSPAACARSSSGRSTISSLCEGIEIIPCAFIRVRTRLTVSIVRPR